VIETFETTTMATMASVGDAQQEAAAAAAPLLVVVGSGNPCKVRGNQTELAGSGCVD
jgi:hypothetical protein